MRIRRTPMKKARIEIIPMIDTIFFLLVFFMMESLSMVQMSARRVHLPTSATARLKPADKVVLTITRSGAYYVDLRRVSEAEIRPLLTEKIQANPAISVVINCDKDQQIARFERAFDLVKQSNAGNVMIATTPRTPEAAAR